MAGDAVEDEAEQPARVGLVLVAGDVVEHPLHHLQLVQRQGAMRWASARGVVVELVVGDALEDHPGVGRLAPRELVAGEEVALGPLQAEPGDPHPGRLGHPPHPGRRVAERRPPPRRSGRR